MDSRQSAWSGAAWIGGSDDDMPFYPHYLPVFKLVYDFQLDEASQSTRSGFIYGANDQRLMDKNKNIFQLEYKKDESYFMIEMDIVPANNTV